MILMYLLKLILIITLKIHWTIAWDNYREYYLNLINIQNGTSSFVVNTLWKGNDGLEIIKYTNEKCKHDINIFRNGVYDDEKWALKMLDASTHVQSGFLEGNIIDYGNFDECLSIDNKLYGILGKYCRLYFGMKEEDVPVFISTYKVGVALCLPASCKVNDVYKILQLGLNESTGINELALYFCETAETQQKEYGILDIIIIVIFALIITIVLTSTIYNLHCNKRAKIASEDTLHLLPKYKNSVCKGLWLSFSLYTNSRNLFKKDEGLRSIKCLHGLRFIACCGILSIHRFLDPQPPKNLYWIEEEIRKWNRMILFNSYLWVDLFFLISGLLITYNFLMKHESKRKVDVFKIYVHRYLRLTPPLAIMILLILISDHMCKGPHCSYLNNYFKNHCVKNWWATLLYINNLYKLEEKCVVQSWYTSADMQLYIVSPLILYVLSRWPNYIYHELAVLFGGCLGIVFYMVTKYDLLPTFIERREFFVRDSVTIYEQFYTRAGPWIIGLALGIILQKYHEKPYQISKVKLTLGWMLSIILCFGSMFGIVFFIQKDYQPDRIVQYLYKTFYRNFWALGFAWIIFACHTGHGGLINKSLSSYVFHPLSRISYSFFLIHTFEQFLQFQNNDAPRKFSDLSQATLITSDIILSIVMASVLYLFVEAPAMNLEKYLWNNRGKLEELEKEMKILTVKEA